MNSTTAKIVKFTVAGLIVAGGVLALLNSGRSAGRSSAEFGVAPAVAGAADDGEVIRDTHDDLYGHDDRYGHRTDGRLGRAKEVYVTGRESVNGQDSAYQTWDSYLSAILNDVDTYWSGQFAAWGYDEPSVTYSFPAPGAEPTTACTAAIDATTMQYCPVDDTLTIHQQAAYDLTTGVSSTGLTNAGAVGDMGIWVVVAHEYGHNLWYELDLWEHSTDAQKERGADCLAGVWAADADRRGILEAGDLAEAYAALDLLAEHPDLGVSDNGVHGTADERHRAFDLGFTQGAAACTRSYSSAWN